MSFRWLPRQCPSVVTRSQGYCRDSFLREVAVRFIIYAIDVAGEKTIFTRDTCCIRLSDAKSFIELPRGNDAHRGHERQDEVTSLQELTAKPRRGRMRYAVALSCTLLLCGMTRDASA